MNAINSTARFASGITATVATLRSALAGSRTGLLAQTGVVAVLALSSAACSSVTAAAPLATPAGHEAVGPAACHASGATKVLARRVFVPAGVQASMEDGAFAVGYAADPSHCLTVEWPSGASHVQPGSCEGPGAGTAARDASGAMLAWDSREDSAPQVTLGPSTSDAPHPFFGFGITANRRAAEQTFRPLVLSSAVDAAPAMAPIGHDRFLVTWVDGDSESHQLRAQSVVGRGAALGPSMVLSPADASVIGKPSVVVAPTGYGLVTYVASLEGEFDVMATPVACAMN